MSLLDLLGLRSGGGDETPGDSAETVRRIARQLDDLPDAQARYLAAFAAVLGRVARADLEVSEEESREMERLVSEVGQLPEEQAVLVVQMAKSQLRLAGGTEGYLATRDFKHLADEQQRRQLLDCLFAVSAADDSISSAEEAQIRQIASELGFTLADFVAARSAWSDKREVLRGLPQRPTADGESE
jgi:uncharacterized tellurite resistance protein B-like protein